MEDVLGVYYGAWPMFKAIIRSLWLQLADQNNQKYLSLNNCTLPQLQALNRADQIRIKHSLVQFNGSTAGIDIFGNCLALVLKLDKDAGTKINIVVTLLKAARFIATKHFLLNMLSVIDNLMFQRSCYTFQN